MGLFIWFWLGQNAQQEQEKLIFKNLSRFYKNKKKKTKYALKNIIILTIILLFLENNKFIQYKNQVRFFLFKIVQIKKYCDNLQINIETTFIFEINYFIN